MGNQLSSVKDGDDVVLGQDGQIPRLYEQQLDAHQWPIIYSSAYNIRSNWLEKILPFDGGNLGKVYQSLVGERN